MDALVGISEFSRRCGISVSALRFYDRCGLLVPAEVDPSTGYRSYGLAQLGEAAVLRDLRLIGLSIAEIRRFNAAPGAEQHQMIAARLAAIEQDARQARAVAADLRRRLIDKESPMPTFRVAATTLAQGFGQVLAAVGSDSEHPVLHNVLIEARDGTLRLVATDSYRMAVRDFAVGNAAGDLSALVPGDVLAEVQRSLPSTGELTVDVSDDIVSVRAEDGTWELSVSDAEFPHYEHLLAPSAEATEATVSRAQLREALEVHLDVDVVRLDLSRQQLTISAADEPTQHLNIAYAGDPVSFGLNPRYAFDAAQHAVGADLVLDITAPDQPIVFRSADDGSYIYMLMPIRLDDARAA